MPVGCALSSLRELPADIKLTTRLYPVDFTEVRQRLESDLTARYDFALHLGQAPGAARIRLEQIAVNVAGHPEQPADEYGSLEPNGPVAYRSDLPLGTWAAGLRSKGIPVEVSHHAGTFLCNATLYWSHFLIERMGLPTQPMFVHLPLDTSQTLASQQGWPAMPAALTSLAVQALLAEMAMCGEPRTA